MCCSTGLCGPSVEPELVHFAALLQQLATLGVKVERYTLSQQPLAFVQNPAVKAALDTGGVEVLPLIFWDGTQQSQGHYPSAAERAEWVRAVGSAQEAPAA
jgi:hypothetical protein